MSQGGFFWGVASGQIAGVTVVALVCLTVSIIVVTGFVTSTWRTLRERQMASTLIQEMMARNISTGEIARVLSVWNEGSFEASDVAELTAKMPREPVVHKATA